ncbi:MAG: hypothetical protein ACK5OX_18740 [Desertimonas sp.]
MSAPLEPPRLQELVDLAERPRADEWSLRAGLCRYAQPQPRRASAVLSAVRRLEAALGAERAVLRTDGPIVAATLEAHGSAHDPRHARSLGLLRLAEDLDRLGDAVAAWAIDRQAPRPDKAIDDTVTRVTDGLTRLGVPEEPSEPPRGARGRG